jgi:hypothetical protein
MAPPASSIQRAKASLLGEPPPSRFFQPTVPVGSSPSAFGGAISPGYAARLNQDVAQYRSQMDDIQTRLAQNELNRAQAGSAGRILPFSEAAAIAQAKLNADQYAASQGLLPQQTEAARGQLQLGTERSRMELEDLPGEFQAKQQQRMNQAQYAESSADAAYLRRLGDDPDAIAVYSAYSEPGVSGFGVLNREGERRRAAGEAIKVIQSRPLIEAIDFAAQGKPGFREQFVEPILDPITKLPIGERIKDTADRNLLAQFNNRYKQSRTKLSEEKEKRIASSQDRAAKISVASKLFEEAKDRFNLSQDDNQAKEEMEKYRKILSRYLDEDEMPSADSAGGPLDMFE